MTLLKHQHSIHSCYCVIEPFECRRECVTRFNTDMLCGPRRQRRKHHSKKHCVQISGTRVFLISAVNKRVKRVVIPPRSCWHVRRCVWAWKWVVCMTGTTHKIWMCVSWESHHRLPLNASVLSHSKAALEIWFWSAVNRTTF